MRTVIVILVSVVLGVILGAGVTGARYGLLLDTWTFSRRWQAPTGPAPKVVVDREEHDFGGVERDATVHHLFRFSNVGGTTLHLEKGGTSCMKCTISDLTEDTVPPGKTVDVAVDYHAALPLSEFKFKQSATILTNDPERPRVTLWVFGNIISAFRVLPPDVVFSKVRTDETKTAEVTLFGFVAAPVQIDGYDWTDPETAAFFDAKFLPVPEEDLKEVGATSGKRVSVTIKPGLPLGTVSQKLRVNTSLPGGQSVEIPVFAKIESDISIAGPGWNADGNTLGFGVVDSQHGAKRKLELQLLGAHRHDVQFQVEKVSPDFLRVTVGEPIDVDGGETVRVPLTIEIPPGSPPANYLGSEQAKLGEVLLSTTHPQAKQLKLSVRFAVKH